jgi:ribonucleotide reductase beta subunit family protein with ferritin-like domain
MLSAQPTIDTPDESPIDLIPGDSRLTTFPIVRHDMFAWYEDATSCFWTVNEVSPTQDISDYATKLSPGERQFVDHVLAFFAAADGIVNINLAERFRKDIDILEVRYFYDYQIMAENVHAHTYSILLDAIIPAAADRARLLNAAKTVPVVADMSDYMKACASSDEPFAARLLRMACVEGIFFTGCFCAIYWLSQRGVMPALAHSNELIARDEALHTMFAMFLYTRLKAECKLSAEDIVRIVTEAVELAKKFVIGSLPSGLAGMNATLMSTYIECQADNLVALIDVPPIYGAACPFNFMDQQNMRNRTNFFERRVSEYMKTQQPDVGDFDVATDF